jgi:hypothetical protein
MKNLKNNTSAATRWGLALTAGVSLSIIAFGTTGCKGLHFGSRAAAKPMVAVQPAVYQPTPLDLAKVQPNEAGQIPIIMYHDVVNIPQPKGLRYPVAMFKKDLEWLYAHNYRPVSLTQFAQGKIDCPAGMSPVILTFDDALKSQFNYDSDGKVDPDCAVGIMDAFHATHPDWPLRATFFVLTDHDPKLPPPFYQKDFAQGKMEYLVNEGFDIGNHTVHHPRMNRKTDQQVQDELAGAVEGIKAYLPNYDVNTVAMPYGIYPKHEKFLITGVSGGTTYHNICAMKAAWRPVPSPMDKAFKPYELERITAGTKFHESHWWLEQYLEKDKSAKFISDGDPQTYTINSIAKGQIDMKRLRKLGFHLRLYNGTQVTSVS